MAQIFLSLEDINQLIKYFAYHLQISIETFHSSSNYPYRTLENKSIENQNDIISKIIKKYNQYCTSNLLELKIARKFIERIKQIFEYFRLKCKQSSKHCFYLIQNRVKQKLNQFLEKQIISVFELIQYVVSLTKQYTFSSIIRQTTARQNSTSKRKYLRPCSTSIKINSYSHTGIQEKEQSYQQQNHTIYRQNHTILQKKLISKSISSFQVMDLGQRVKNNRARPSTSQKNRMRLYSTRNLKNEQSQHKNQKMRNNASKARNFEPYLKIYYKQQSKRTLKPLQLGNLYTGMSIDVRYIQKMCQREGSLLRDMLKRNEKIIASVRKQQKQRVNLSTLLDQTSNDFTDPLNNLMTGFPIQSSHSLQDVLKPYNCPKTCKILKNSHQQAIFTGISQNNLGNWKQSQVRYGSKRKCLRNLSYQSYVQKKKKVGRKFQNGRLVEGKDNGVGVPVQDKENYQRLG